jgi:hypothetical protein
LQCNKNQDVDVWTQMCMKTWKLTFREFVMTKVWYPICHIYDLYICIHEVDVNRRRHLEKFEYNERFDSQKDFRMSILYNDIMHSNVIACCNVITYFIANCKAFFNHFFLMFSLRSTIPSSKIYSKKISIKDWDIKEPPHQS